MHYTKETLSDLESWRYLYKMKMRYKKEDCGPVSYSKWEFGIWEFGKNPKLGVNSIAEYEDKITSHWWSHMPE